MSSTETPDISIKLSEGGLLDLLPKHQDSRKRIAIRIILLLLITWVPLFILSMNDGTHLSSDQENISFLEDLMVNFKFLVVVPLLIIIGLAMNKVFTDHLVYSYNLIEGPRDSFLNHLKWLERLKNSHLVDVIILIMIYSVIIFNWKHIPDIASGKEYMLNEYNAVTLAGKYYLFVSNPILLFLGFRWFWRWAIWVISLNWLRKNRMRLDPFHADQMAGLDYLGIVPFMFSILAISASILISARIGILILYQGASLQQYVLKIVIFVVLMNLLIYSPLILFIGKMIKAKSYGRHRFGDLLREHNQKYAGKWIDDRTTSEDLLGSVDHSSLADINGSYGPIQNLKIIPLESKALIGGIVLNLLPFVPLLFTEYSIMEIIKMIFTDVIGG